MRKTSQQACCKLTDLLEQYFGIDEFAALNSLDISENPGPIRPPFSLALTLEKPLSLSLDAILAGLIRKTIDHHDQLCAIEFAQNLIRKLSQDMVCFFLSLS